MYMDNEIWKDIKYDNIKPDMYEVSNNGYIRNKITGKIMTQCPSEKGYLMSSLMCTSNKSKCFKIHRIVTTMFIPHDEKLNEVNHIDCIKYHNNVENLEWVDRIGNMRHAIKNGLVPVMSGVKNGSCKHDENIIHEICKLLLLTNGSPAGTIYLINNEYLKCGNVNKTIVEDIKRKRTWKHISDKYFTKGQFMIYTPITVKIIRVICQEIIESNSNLVKIQKNLMDKGYNVHESTIVGIMNKEHWTCISKYYI